MMKNREILTRVLAVTGLVAIAACGDDCGIDWGYGQLCNQCDAQGETAYECNYHAKELFFDSSGAAVLIDRYHRLSGCWPSAEAADDACVAACSGFWRCESHTLETIDCAAYQEGSSSGTSSGSGETSEPIPTTTAGEPVPTTGETSEPIPTTSNGSDSDGGSDSEGSGGSGGVSQPILGPVDCTSWQPASQITADPTGAQQYSIGWGLWFSVLSNPYLLDCEGASGTANPFGSGFVLGTVDSSSMLAALGLQTGDVLISLGRRRLDSVDDLMAAFMSLPNALSFTLYIERAGTQMTLQYQVQ